MKAPTNTKNVMRILVIFLVCTLSLAVVCTYTSKKTVYASAWDGSTADYFAGGSGTIFDPYQIATAEQLRLLSSIISGNTASVVIQDGASVAYATLQEAYYILTNDIELNDEEFTYDPDTGLIEVTDGTNVAYIGTGSLGNTSGSNTQFDASRSIMGAFYTLSGGTYSTGAYPGALNDWSPIGTSAYRFKGSLDGNGFTVSGLYLDNTSGYQGLFGYVQTAIIENLGVVHSYVKGGSNTGSIVGCAYDYSVIQNCYNEGVVVSTGSYIGGIVGYNNSHSSIINSYNTGYISGASSFLGGIVGMNSGSDIANCYNTGYIDMYDNGTHVGGIVGGNGEATITNCYNT